MNRRGVQNALPVSVVFAEGSDAVVDYDDLCVGGRETSDFSGVGTEKIFAGVKHWIVLFQQIRG